MPRLLNRVTARRCSVPGPAGLCLALLTIAQGAALTVAAKEALRGPENTVAARPAGAPVDGPFDELELDESDAKIVEPTVIEASEPTFSILEVAGRFHPALCHFPIAWLVLLCMVELASARRGRPLAFSGLFGISLTALSFVPAVTTGFLRSWTRGEDDLETLAEVALHRNVMIIVAVLCLSAFALRLRGFAAGRRIANLYLLLLVAAAALVLVGGHLGARLAHGDDYLGF